MNATLTGNIDLAQISLYLFWLFFAILVYYLQTENMREGYPLEDEDGNAQPSTLPLPAGKTFILPNGQGEVTVPDYKREAREVALVNQQGGGYPLEPTGDPMVDGVGPASWAPRRDIPELDGHGKIKVRPLSMLDGYEVSAGRDPRGMEVQAGDGEIVGKISDIWLDAPEKLVLYLEVELDAEHGGGKRLIPMQLLRILKDRVKVHSIFGKHFANVPQAMTPGQVTMREEDKICAYYAGGKLYASEGRYGPILG